jgi:FimV-like protein
MKLKLSIALILIIFTSSKLFALTLNKMQVSSKQDEPLNAVINVTFSKDDKASNLKPAIASKENYEANGLSRLPIHSDIQIRLEESANGANLILTSKKIVKDPFLDLLIQIDSDKGRKYKEYTVLIDPPEPKISLKKEQLANNEAAPAVEEVKVAPAVEEVKVAPAVEEVKVAPAVEEVKVKKKKNTDSKIIKSSNRKTLYQIARENKPSGVTTEQMVLAIFQNNPQAFSEDNVNTLLNNKNLKIPPVSYFENHSHLEARKILRDQNIEWKNKTKKKNNKVKIKKVKETDTAKINQLEKELIEAKSKLEELSKLNEEKKQKVTDDISIEPSINKEELKDKKVSNEELNIEEVKEEEIKDKESEVFVSSISNIDEKIIDEKIIDEKEGKGLETIHVLLLVLFFVLLFGLFVVISRRNRSEKNNALRSFGGLSDDLDRGKNDLEQPARDTFKTDSESFSDSKNINSETNSSDNLQTPNTDNNSRKKNYLPIADDD